MASDDVRRLWKVHGLDLRILDVRRRAAALDGGVSLKKKLDAYLGENAAVIQRAKSLGGEATDLELANESITAKLAKFEREIYSGAGLGARELKLREKETETLTAQRDANDERLLTLFDELPPAREAAAKIQAEVARREAEIARAKVAAKPESDKLKVEFAELQADRATAAKAVTAPLLTKYDQIRKNHGTGMAELKRPNLCGTCGMTQPLKAIETLKGERGVVACEACHRILYFTEDLV